MNMIQGIGEGVYVLVVECWVKLDHCIWSEIIVLVGNMLFFVVIIEWRKMGAVIGYKGGRAIEFIWMGGLRWECLIVRRGYCSLGVYCWWSLSRGILWSWC